MKISKKQLDRGTKVEMEHANTIKKFMKNGVSVKRVARQIAKDHLMESPSYYNELSKMENKLNKSNKK